MTWLWWSIGGYCLLMVNFIVLWACLSSIRRAGEREMNAAQLANEAMECADLLRHIAAQSFMSQHNGTFQAWAETMGMIRVNVQVESHEFHIDVGKQQDERALPEVD